MSLREMELSDLVALEKDAKFPLPNLSGGKFIIKKTIENEKGLIASFWVKITSEVSLVINSESSNLDSARAIKEVFEFLKEAIPKLGIDDTYLVIKENNAFSELMKKHFSFKELDTTLYLSSEILRRENGQS